MSADEMNFGVVIPAYREAGRIGGVVEDVRRHCPHVIVVDDGSPDDGAAEAERAGATVVRHGVNRGKGVALSTGFAKARERGYEFLITLDADGQHDPSEIPLFVAEYRRGGWPVIIGSRMGDPRGMPLVRRLTNQFMSWLLSREMGQRVPDTQSGYRLFRCDVLADVTTESSRFAAESEILLKLADKGVRIGSVPIRVIYRDEKSKINPFKDTFRFFAMLRQHRRQRAV